MTTSSQVGLDPEVSLSLAYRQSQIQALNVEQEDQRAASSQRRNILFTANGCDIYVWIPSGPFQLLGSQAEMVIKPLMQNPRAAGYIDRLNPHTINNILVDDLGRDEVLLLATDSGNVCGYHVEAIYSAVKRCAEANFKRPFDGSEVNPFFVENVGMSAWGLATHKFARLIAVSANTGQITVYAFALVESKSGDNDDPSYETDSTTLNMGPSGQNSSDNTWVSINHVKQLKDLQKLMPYHHRSRNLRLTYRGHFDNIPHISFANFDLDANGMWMVSTDISNRVIIWRIWDDLGPTRVYYPGHPMNNPPQRGWTVIPLDPRTFKRYGSKEEACGCQPRSLLIGSRTILDVSRGIENVSDASQIFVFGYSTSTSPRNRDSATSDLPDDVFSSDCCLESHSLTTSEKDYLDIQETHSSAAPQISQSESENSFGSEHDESEESNRIVRVKRSMSKIFEEENKHYLVSPCLHPGYHYDYETGSDPTLKTFKTRPVHPKKDPAFFPVIHFSEHHISMAPYPMDSDYHLLCRTPLFQRVSFDLEISSACDRFNMVKYISELGLVVAASQKGRVAIICLTWQENIGYAFRLDWIVPFYTQERDAERPIIPLLGMAVSPMPGYEVPPDVPCIPRDVDPADWIKFNYRIINTENDEPPSSIPSPAFESSILSTSPATTTIPNHFDQREPDPRSSRTKNENPSISTAESDSESNSSIPGDHPQSAELDDEHWDYTLPELHACASQTYRPKERWHGWHASRHYRLLLLYCDHTVMSYEFWHDWKD
ncbi:hypothetical protein N7462_010406 [Penicillium macrosclerotiorum]|uniref:uncharacterized protein n=1 Tax=Penicillium macrosclerotiorum TaxID=303699 RepID=UPI002549B72D|nr:uncharacterized protein N7462_010406 [Penicillium macrosclerotiorum]KAJ5669336.1 hypothetical protein N7462_010406 [Penicillium macrosclerotiorum]